MKVIATIVDGDRASLVAYFKAQATVAATPEECAEWAAMAALAENDKSYCRKMFATLKRTAKQHGKKITYPTTPS